MFWGFIKTFLCKFKGNKVRSTHYYITSYGVRVEGVVMGYDSKGQVIFQPMSNGKAIDKAFTRPAGWVHVISEDGDVKSGN